MLAVMAVIAVLASGCSSRGREPQQKVPEVKEEVNMEIAEDCGADKAKREKRQPDMSVHVRQGERLVIHAGGMELKAEGSAVRREADYSVTSLHREELPPLPQGMTNMTAEAAGYRLLPGCEHFSPGADLRVKYDPRLLPAGYTPEDIHTSFYDTATQAWVRLERVSVDTMNQEIVSLTTHFTDFINELLKVPEMPESRAYVPTQLSNIEAANPMEGLTLIQPPTANNNGTANISYPLVIPAGRGGMQPNLALTYSSGGGYGWLGVGWDIPVPSVTLDTRWGVPRYDEELESEIYLLEGEQLVTKDTEGKVLPLPHRTNRQQRRATDGKPMQFYARIGDAHDSIVRHGIGPKDYWWEVVDRGGKTHYYGHYADSVRSGLPSVLCDDNGNIARWMLAESRDPYGNSVRYYYAQATARSHGNPGRQIYLDSISYTGHGPIDGYYTVVFCRMADTSSQMTVTCNNGFKEITGQSLNSVYVKYGDSILTAWHFEMENGYRSNYKNRLASMTKIDAAEGGLRNFLSQFCHCVASDEDSALQYSVSEHTEKDTVTNEIIVVYDTEWYNVMPLEEVHKGYAGTTYRFEYHNALPPDSLFDARKISDLRSSMLHGMLLSDPLGMHDVTKATALGLSHSSSWNIGGTAAGGLGPVICLTTTSVGGNYTRGGSASESLMTLIDLDGDGLADKVYVNGGHMYFCRHVNNGDGTMYFEEPRQVEGASHFLRESSRSNTFGAQMAVGFSGSVSWTNTSSATSTYFADVNGDGLVDIVDNGQVLFNNLLDGYPRFIPYEEPHIEGQGWEGRDSVVVTSASRCGGIIFDGEVDDSITCERVWKADTSFVAGIGTAEAYAQSYEDIEDTMVTVEPYGGEDSMMEVRLYHREWDCKYHDGAPRTEAVRVWVAPHDGTIHLSGEVWLEEDTSAARRAARHADGVVYTIQLTRDIKHMWRFFLPTNKNSILSRMQICDSCYYERDAAYLYQYDTTIDISSGDMLFFRLGSVENRRFDNVHDRHHIEYLGATPLSYDSYRDFVLSGDHCFQAPSDGRFKIECEYTGSSNAELVVSIADSETYVYTGTGEQSIVESDSITAGDNICFAVRANGGAVDWGQVKCRPHITFYPDTSYHRIDSNNYVSPVAVDTSRIADSVSGWIPCRMEVTHAVNSPHHTPLYRRLFGPLYNGWGQFAYHTPDTGRMAEYIRLERLLPTDMMLQGIAKSSDSSTFDSTVHVGDSLTESDLSGSMSLESFQNSSGINTPLSYASYWVEMTPDVEHGVWMSYGRQSHVGRATASNALQERWYKGSAANTGDGLEEPDDTEYDDAVPAAAPNGTPAKAVRKVNRSESKCYSIGAAIFGASHSHGTNAIVTDYMDLNGDRYPDNIGRDRVQYSQQWGGIGKVRDMAPYIAESNGSKTTSTGVSHSAKAVTMRRIVSGSQSEAMFTEECEGSGKPSGGGNIGRDMATGTWTDINGDGLVDLIDENGNVHLNIGYGFLSGEDWKCDTTHAGISGSISESVSGDLPDDFFNLWQGSIQAGAGISASYNKSTVQLVDINGDGLPDKVRRRLSNITEIIDSGLVVTEVLFNKGNGHWSNAMRLNIDHFHSSTTYNESLNVGLTYGFTLWGVLKVTVGVDGSPYSGSVTRDHVQLADVDGDGLPDLVCSNEEGTLIVRRNLGGRTNLLKRVTNFTGSTIDLDYQLSAPSYEQPSRSWLLTRVATKDPQNPFGGDSTVMEFSYKEPHYDRYERQSLGYARVTESMVNPNDGNVYRKVERNYDNSSFLRRGRLKREMTTDGEDHPYVERLMHATYTDYHSDDTITPGDCPLMAYPSVEATLTHYYEGGEPAKLTVGERREYDRYHNVVSYTDLGDIDDPDDGLTVTLEYLEGKPYNLIGLLSDYRVYSPDGTTLLRHGTYKYNDKGRLESLLAYNGGETSIYDYKYDTIYGNKVMATGPENHNGERLSFRLLYDNEVHSYPVMVTNSYGDTSYTTYDLRFGKPLKMEDVSGNTMSYAYDFAGRMVGVVSPLDGGTAIVNRYHPTNYYHNGMTAGDSLQPSPTGHSYAVAEHYGDRGALVTETVVITDGLGRAVQTKKGLTVGDSAVMQVSGRVVSDAFGRAVEQYDPVTESLATHRGRLNISCDPASRTTTAYDVLDRPLLVRQPTGAMTRTYYSINNDGHGHRRFYTVTVDPNFNAMSLAKDYDGHTVECFDAGGGTTEWVYDNMGQPVSVKDPEGFTTTYAYDMLGRMVQRQHPDAGTSNYTYDKAGNLTEENNQLGQIFYDYTYQKPKTKRYSNLTGNDVTYTYGTTGNDRSRLHMVEDGSGSCKLHYDALGNVVEESRTIAVPGGGVYTFQTQYRYDTWGRMLDMTYADGERVEYRYLWGGELGSMRGEKGGTVRSYIDSIHYNAMGQRESVRYGNGTTVHYSYDVLHRLERLTSRDGNGATMQNITYTFDPAGNITDITNAAPALGSLGGGYANSYSYDELYRLVSSTGTGTAGNYGIDMQYSPSGRLMGRQRTAVANEVPPDAVLCYGYSDEQQPHAVRRIYNELDYHLTDVRWDAAGNVVQVSKDDGNGFYDRGRFLYWTEDNRLHTVADDDNYSYYAYDASGERRLKMTGSSTIGDINADRVFVTATLKEVTLYPSPYVVVSNKGYTKHYYAGAERVAAGMGGGGLGELANFLEPNDGQQTIADGLLQQCLTQVNGRHTDANTMSIVGMCHVSEMDIYINGIPDGMSAEVGADMDEFAGMANAMVDAGADTGVYFYHSDHLGSASWITDSGGAAVQHLQYLPFGEPYVNQRTSGYSERFTFTGKERDEETGYGYFGARYMDHELMTMWLSVDPMSDKYPSISPYAYCAWNPVRLLDPDGQEIDDYYNLKGEKIKHTNEGDNIYLVLTKGKEVIEDRTIVVPTNATLNKMRKIYSYNSQLNEKGIAVESDGSCAGMATGSKTHISKEQWQPIFDDINNRGAEVDFLVHLHPADFAHLDIGDRNPSDLDRQHSNFYNSKLGAILSYVQPFDFNRTGQSTDFKDYIEYISFYNETSERYIHTMKFMDFESLVKDINKKNGRQ